MHQDLLIQGSGDRIVVATQAVEAGVDVSARVLITELAPWCSIVQRLGRSNRGGEFNIEGAEVHWLDLVFDRDADVAPYTLDELKVARAELEKLEGSSVSPEALNSVKVIPPPVIRPVIRHKASIDLFDTTTDIAGHGNGRPSWLARMNALRDEIGPFGLAYLETLLRADDMRASAAEALPDSPALANA